MNYLAILLGKIVSILSRVINLGDGSTWPGYIALTLNKNFIKESLNKNKIKIILICGTNGKTTTSKIIETILYRNGEKILSNNSGSNLLNGIASSIVLGSDLSGKINHTFAVFEVDENTIKSALDNLSADYIICLNLFRDQLDRYGEVDLIFKLWEKSFEGLNKDTTLILNADDPQISNLSNSFKGKSVFYFGLNSKSENTKTEHASDSILCPNCNGNLEYKSISFSHLGDWFCTNCTRKRAKLDISNYPYFPLIGTYNKYNVLSAVLLLEKIGIKKDVILSGLKSFEPAFGRQEKVKYKNKNVWLFLAKNPTGFNETLKTLNDKQNNNFLFLLNDKIADGRDVSWIWDVDFENFIKKNNKYRISGSRVYDLGLRFKYAGTTNENIQTIENVKDAIDGLVESKSNQDFYIVATYTAMLEVRKILTGKEIL